MYFKPIICLLFAFLISYNDAASVEAHNKDKKSPFLRLDELSNRVYLAKNRLGGGLIDPLEIGKRSPFLRLDELSNRVYLAKNRLGGGLIDPLEIGKREFVDEDSQIELATTLFEGFQACVKLDGCSKTLKYYMENYN